MQSMPQCIREFKDYACDGQYNVDVFSSFIALEEDASAGNFVWSEGGCRKISLRDGLIDCLLQRGFS